MGVCFTGVYQRWTTYALKPESVSEMHFHANSKKAQSLGKNGCRQKCLHKSLDSQNESPASKRTESKAWMTPINLNSFCTELFLWILWTFKQSVKNFLHYNSVTWNYLSINLNKKREILHDIFSFR